MATNLGAMGQLLSGTAQAFGTVGAIMTFTSAGTTQMPYAPAQTWASWNNLYATQTVVNNQWVWGNWNAQYTPTVQTFVMPAPPSAEDTAELIRQSEENCRKREEGRKRAEEFLLENLSPHQRETYEKHKMFIVEAPSKRRYALHKERQPHQLDGEREVVRYCIHTLGVPREDELLGFKLLLEANEEEFLKTANATRLAA